MKCTALVRQNDERLGIWFRHGPLVIFSVVLIHVHDEAFVETHGPLGTLIAGLGLGAFYMALIWVNLLLGHFLTPLFLIPLTWLQDAVLRRKQRSTAAA